LPTFVQNTVLGLGIFLLFAEVLSAIVSSSSGSHWVDLSITKHRLLS